MTMSVEQRGGVCTAGEKYGEELIIRASWPLIEYKGGGGSIQSWPWCFCAYYLRRTHRPMEDEGKDWCRSRREMMRPPLYRGGHYCASRIQENLYFCSLQNVPSRTEDCPWRLWIGRWPGETPRLGKGQILAQASFWFLSQDNKRWTICREALISKNYEFKMSPVIPLC